MGNDAPLSNSSLKSASSIAKENEKYSIRRITTETRQTYQSYLKYLQNYLTLSQETDQIAHLLKITTHQHNLLCSTTFQINLYFEHSNITLQKELIERAPFKHFLYKDICNVLYGCLSSMWFASENSHHQFSPYGTIFLSPEKLLILQKGVIKVTDPLQSGYEDRINFNQKIMYSPQKMLNFTFIDDEKCAVFQLGMMLLTMATLRPLKYLYRGNTIRKRDLCFIIRQAKTVYSAQITDTGDINVFQLLQRMLRFDRSQRYNLDQCITFAEQIYQLHEHNLDVILEERESCLSVQREAMDSQKITKIEEKTKATFNKSGSKYNKNSCKDSYLVSSFNVDQPLKSSKGNNLLSSNIFQDIEIKYRFHLQSEQSASSSICNKQRRNYYKSRLKQMGKQKQQTMNESTKNRNIINVSRNKQNKAQQTDVLTYIEQRESIKQTSNKQNSILNRSISQNSVCIQKATRQCLKSTQIFKQNPSKIVYLEE